MSAIKEKIETDLKTALRQKAGLLVSVLRLLLSEIHNFEIEKRQPPTDEDVQNVLVKSRKRHLDSIKQFETGGRADLVTKEQAELKVIESYLPKQLSPEELLALVKDAVRQAGEGGQRPTLGEVMKFLVPKVKGWTSGQMISDLVKQELAK